MNGLGAGDGKPDGLEAETGVFRRRQRFELQVDETRNVRHIACRQGQPDIDRLHRAIDAIKGKPQRARSHIVAGQHMHEDMHEAVRQRDDRLLA